MNNRKPQFPPPADQLINQITHQGRPPSKGRTDGGLCRVTDNSLPATALAGVVGQLNPSQGAGGQINGTPAKGPPCTEYGDNTRRIINPQPDFISFVISYLERGVTKP